MPAYVVVDVEVLNPTDYEDYKKFAKETVTLYGGHYLVRGAEVEVVEGTWHPKRFVILEFPSLERAKQWYHSPEYVKVVGLRHRNARSHLIMVDGVAGQV